jgi:hypothetical protein
LDRFKDRDYRGEVKDILNRSNESAISMPIQRNPDRNPC